nr:hypothetical protein [uncultured Brevundimonas sp.]
MSTVKGEGKPYSEPVSVWEDTRLQTVNKLGRLARFRKKTPLIDRCLSALMDCCGRGPILKTALILSSIAATVDQIGR